MAKIIITGSKGQLGQCLLDAAIRFPVHNFLSYDIDQLDICDTQAVYQTAMETGATAIINCAAYTAVDQAEQEREQAWAINAKAVKGLAEVCDRLNMLLIHISTDFVFDGVSSTPYTEDDLPNPLSEYGASKLAGEQFALSYKRGVVVRTSWLYAPVGHNFMSTILRLGVQKDEIKVVCDQTGSPTYGPHLAEALLRMVTQIEASQMPDSLMGLYHYANRGSCSRFAFAQKIKEVSEFRATILPVASSEYPALAKRPAYSVLDTKKISAFFGIVPPCWADAIRPYMLFVNHKP
ncbi:MAG: dTDP-4-dehydrorhamnose reductase [Bacteroidales bacterium]|nr:dTDP-4-dehydrorhamnose reductase [Bacteroidales bacterium]